MMKKLIAAAALMTVAAMSTVQAAEIKFLTSQQPGEWLSYRLAGTKVLDSKGEKLGKVKDVVIDATGQVSAVVLGIGGYFGFAEKAVAVSISDITIGEVLGGSRIVVLDTTAAALKAAPPYTASDPTKTDRLKKLAKDWSATAKQKAIELSKKAAEKAKDLSKQAAEKAKDLSKQAAEKAKDLKDQAAEAAKKQTTPAPPPVPAPAPAPAP